MNSFILYESNIVIIIKFKFLSLWKYAVNMLYFYLKN